MVHRIVSTLRAGGLLEQEPGTRRYRIGIGLFDLGSRYAHRHRWFPLALDAVKDLVRWTGHAAYVGVLSGPDVVVLAAEAGAHRVRLIVNPGERFPAYSAAIGKALLARLPVEQVRELYGSGALAQVTKATIPHVPALLEELRRVRERRYAAADQETFIGIKAAGVGFTSPPDGESFAISISYPLAGVSRRDERRIVDALLQMAERLGRMLGDPWWGKALVGAARR